MKVSRKTGRQKKFVYEAVVVVVFYVARSYYTLFFYKNVGYKNIRLKFPIFYLIALRTSLHKTLRLNSFGDVLIKKN